MLCGKTGVGKTSIFRRMCGSDLDSPQKGCARNTLDPVECNVSVELEKETKTEVFLLLFKHFINPFTLQDARKC